jgi:hypothetical protein
VYNRCRIEFRNFNFRGAHANLPRGKTDEELQDVVAGTDVCAGVHDYGDGCQCADTDL